LPLDPILRPGATTKTGSSSGSEPGRFSTARRVQSHDDVARVYLFRVCEET